MPPIDVLFDTQAFRSQRFGGISRYFAELIQRLPKFGVNPRYWMPLSDNEHAVSARLSFGIPKQFGGLQQKVGKGVRAVLRCTDRVFAARGNYSILHRTHYAPPSRVPRPSVCTVVDMIPELFPAMFPQGNPHRSKREVVEASDLILSISECTSRDLVAVHGCDPKKIVTVHLGIDTDSFVTASVDAAPSRFPRPYLLFVGGRYNYKNFTRFSEAAAAVMTTHPGLSLAVIGGGALTSLELSVFEKAGVQQRVHQANVADADLPAIYRGADVFIFPSEYEGFGLPLLESFASGCPVAASRASCFPEIGGTAIEYFDPKSADDIAHAITQILDSPSRAQELRRLGTERVRLFSWDRTAEQTAAAYRRLL